MSEIEKDTDKCRVGYVIRQRGGIDKILKERKTNLVYIIAGTGSGKSFWVKHDLSKTGRILFVTSRKAKVLQDKTEIESNLSFSDKFNDFTNIVCTNNALCKHIKDLCSNASKEDGLKNVDNFIKGFDYIVFDEFHSFVCDSTFNRDVFNVAVFFAYCAIKKKKKTILLSATVEPVKFFIDALSVIFKGMPDTDGISDLDLTKECDYVLPEKIRVIEKNKKKNDEIESLLNDGENIMYFMNSVGESKLGKEGEVETQKKNKKNHGNTIYQEYDYLLKYGLKEEEIAVIVSKEKQEEWDSEHNCEKNKESSLQGENKDGKWVPAKISFNEWVREEIILNQEIPKGIRVLLCSATLNEGININNEGINTFKYVITDAHYISTLKQQMGRLRNNLKEFWVIKDARQHCNFYDEIEAKLVTSEFQGQSNFLNSLTEYAESISDYKEREEFITWICNKKKFNLVEYSYLTHRFEFNNLRRNMIDQVNYVEKEMKNGEFKNMCIWQDKLKKFANEHDIVFESSNKDRIDKELRRKAEIKKHINSILGNKFYKETWNKEKEILSM